MRCLKYSVVFSSLLLLALNLSSCSRNTHDQQSSNTPESGQPASRVEATKVATPALPKSLPVAYQTASYVVNNDETDTLTIAEESQLKVGARITSTRGPQPLWDIVKRLASLKGMNVSWASDVDRNVLVDVDINANDDFYDALDNMLRQVDYYHEMSNSTIIVKYKDTRQFQIAMPFIKQTYKTNTGGDVLGGNASASNNVAGEISILTEGAGISQHKDGAIGGVDFNTWSSIENNLSAILNIWSTDAITSTGTTETAKTESNSDISEDTTQQQDNATIRRSSGANSYFIDKPVGLITVTAPRPLLNRVETYIDTLKRELYKQIAIEAKILEVQLDEESKLGIDWTNVLKDFNINGAIEFGKDGLGVLQPGSGQIISKISVNNTTFNVLLNALNEQGDTKVLSNPKISVMNGQPALITVGRNITYIDSIESERDDTTGDITFTVNTERILSGIGMALTATVLGKDEVVMNLVPITSELEGDIEYRAVGNEGGTVGLPIINIREMSTTVKVNNGEMLVIGGLISDTNENTEAFAPGLGNIPGLKYLFGHEQKIHRKRELIILLKPRIM